MTAPTPDPTTASVGERERLIEAILATRWPNGDRFNGVNEWTAGMIADSILANHAAPTVDGATVDEAAVAAILAAHGWEWGDGLEMLHCDCGWSIDGYIGHEEGLAERDAANAMTEGREVPAVIRHRAHVAQMIAATVPTSPTAPVTDDGRVEFIPAANSAFHIGDKVRVVLEGVLTGYNRDDGHYHLRGASVDREGIPHVPWLYTLHWSTLFHVIEAGPRNLESGAQNATDTFKVTEEAGE